MSEISNYAKSISSKEHINISTNVGDDAERLFQELTGAIPSSDNDNIKHVDYIYHDMLIDVKGLKESVLNGYLLIEFISVNGSYGWCHKKSKATHIAFQMKDNFILINKDDLRKKTLSLCKINDFDTLDDVIERIYRGNNLIDKFDGYDNILYELLGRKNRKDVFTYIKINDILDLPKTIIKINEDKYI